MTTSKFLSEVLLVGLQFSFSLTGCLAKVKEPSLRYYFRIAGEGELDEYLTQEH